MSCHTCDQSFHSSAVCPWSQIMALFHCYFCSEPCTLGLNSHFDCHYQGQGIISLSPAPRSQIVAWTHHYWDLTIATPQPFSWVLTCRFNGLPLGTCSCSAAAPWIQSWDFGCAATAPCPLGPSHHCTQ